MSEAVAQTQIPIFKPYSDDEEIAAVTRVLQSGWWGQGSEAAAFEVEFAAAVQAKHAVAVNSATSGLHLALMAAGIGYGDEVIVTPLTFVSSAAAILYVGATPVFADIDPRTLNLDPEDVARKLTPYTKAILVVHYGGAPANLAALRMLAEIYHLTLIEDCAHAAGATYHGRPIGGLATELAVFSLHAVKNIASPDGGVVVTRNEQWAERMRKLRWLGIDRDTYARSGGTPSQNAWEYDIEEIGYKYQMPDVTAAIARVQLKRLKDTNGRRTAIAARYRVGLCDLDWLQLPVVHPPQTGSTSAWHLFAVRCNDRDALHDHLKVRGIATGVHYRPVHEFAAFAAYRTPLPVVEREWLRLLTLPLYPGMSDEDVFAVVEAVRDFRI